MDAHTQSSMPLPLSHTQDEFIWGPTRNGKFTIKSLPLLCKVLDQVVTCTHVHAKLLDFMWKLNIPPKVKLFCWLLICNRLKTR